MKKSVLALIVTLLVLVLSGCTQKTATDVTSDSVTSDASVDISETFVSSPELEKLQKEIESAGKLIGVAYLGWLEGDMETACRDAANLDYTKDYPFVGDIKKYAENEGGRMYLIVPAESVNVSVSKCEFDDDYMPHAGEKLVSANEPILVRGNMSDVIPNIYVVAEKGSRKIEYTPFQSGKDGRLDNSEDLVYDFTPYDSLAEFADHDEVPDDVFCGNWSCLANDGMGEERTLSLTIEPDGSAKYIYGIGNGMILEWFEGSWSVDDDIITLNLTGGPIDNMDDLNVHDPRQCNASFEWEITTEGLTLRHVDGDNILYDTKGDTFNFEGIDY